MNGLSVSGLCHSFGDRPVVSDLSIDVAPGEIVSLLGPSGCGKTTTLRLVAGLEPLQKGEIRLDGVLVGAPGVHVAPEKRKVGLVFQDFALFPHLTVAGNVAFGLRMPADQARDRTIELLRRVGLADHADHYPHVLSGGEQQRVALVRALAPAPRLMLMDEPFSGLDVRLRDQVREDTASLLAATGTAGLLVTHDPEEAMRLADRIAVMRDGRIVQIGSPDDLYDRPADASVARFFSETNTLPGRAGAGCVATPWGSLPVAGMGEGTAVEILVRPEALSVGPGVEGVPALVEAVRPLGASRLLRLRIDGVAVPWLARVSARVDVSPGSRVAVALEPAHVHVFPLTAASLPR